MGEAPRTSATQNVVAYGKHVATRVQDSCMAASQRVSFQYEQLTERCGRYYAAALTVFKKGIVVMCVAMLLGMIIAVVFSLCLIGSVVTVATFRHLMLSNVPGSTITPLSINVLPLLTEWWRHKPILDTIYSTTQHQPPQVPPLQGMSEGERMAMWQRALSDNTALSLETRSTDLKISLLESYIQSVVATSTLIIPSYSSPEVFTVSGAVNYEAIFNGGPPLFNAKGEYSAKVQLVFVKESEGRNVPVMLHTSMLFSEDADAPQSLASLDVLFQNTRTAYVHSGPDRLWWPLRALRQIARMIFYIQVRAYELSRQFIMDNENAPFPPFDSEREVAVVLDAYQHFTPPVSLQPRLKAVNFTVYQYPELDEPDVDEDKVNGRKSHYMRHAPPRLKLARATFYSTVQLVGVARFLTIYPIFSFLCLSLFCFSIYSMFALGALAVLFYVGYLSFFAARRDTHSFEEYMDELPFYEPPIPRKQRPSTRHTSSHTSTPRSDSFAPVLFDVSQLVRSSSSHYYSIESPRSTSVNKLPPTVSAFDFEKKNE